MAQEHDAASSYLRTFAVVFGFALLGLGLFNVAVDPYSLVDTVQISRVNDRKVQPGENIYPLKSLGSIRTEPSAMLLGSSRTEVGLDPKHPAWHDEATYNLGIPGADIHSLRIYFEQAHRIRPLQRVVLAIEYSMFDGSGRDMVDTTWLLTRDGGVHLPFWGRLVGSFFAFDTLIDSIVTLGRSVYHRPVYYRRDGLRLWDHKTEKLRKTGGHRPHFLRLIKAMRDDHQTLSADNLRYARALDDYRQMVRTAYADGIDLQIVISPEHAWMSEARDALDPTRPTDTWRRDVLRIAGEEAKLAALPRYPLRDFASFSGPNLERVPGEADSQLEMRWYWEASHYKLELGDVVLARALAGTGQDEDLGADFGILLEDSNLEGHLARARLRRDAWAAHAPGSVALIHALMAEGRDLQRPRRTGALSTPIAGH